MKHQVNKTRDRLAADTRSAGSEYSPRARYAIVIAISNKGGRKPIRWAAASIHP